MAATAPAAAHAAATVATPPHRIAPTSLEARVCELEAQLASVHLILQAHSRTAADVLQLAQRQATRLEAAQRGVRLGRPPGSSGTAAHPSKLAARDAAEIGLTSSDAGETEPLFEDMRGAEEAIFECLLESLTGYLVERNVTVATASSIDLEHHARKYQAEMDRGWPFSSSKHFSRRVAMVIDQLRAHGLRVTKMRSTKGKRFFRIEQLALDGFPLSTSADTPALSPNSAPQNANSADSENQAPN